VSELLYGAERSNCVEINRREVHATISRIKVVPFDMAAAEQLARLRAHFETAGKRRPRIDLMIAAQVVAAGATLVSHFGRRQAVRQERPGVWLALLLSAGAACGSNAPGGERKTTLEAGVDGPIDGAADATYRIQGWDFLMAGGALYNNLDYSFTVGHEDGTFEPPAATPGGGSAALRRQLRYLRAFFDEIPFWRMQPAGEGAVRGPDGATVRSLEEPGKVYAIYVHHGRAVKGGKPQYHVDSEATAREVMVRLPAGNYSVMWRDTRSGVDVKSETVTVTGRDVRLTSPVYSEDVALLVRAVSARRR